jgi:hypothetical protein
VQLQKDVLGLAGAHPLAAAPAADDEAVSLPQQSPVHVAVDDAPPLSAGRRDVVFLGREPSFALQALQPVRFALKKRKKACSQREEALFSVC